MIANFLEMSEMRIINDLDNLCNYLLELIVEFAKCLNVC